MLGIQQHSDGCMSAVFSVAEQSIVLALLSLYGIGERRFWQLYFVLKKAQLSLLDFWNYSAEIQKKFIDEKFVESIKKHKYVYKNDDYEQWLLQHQISPIVWSTKNYPERLKTIDFPPPILYVRGELPAMHAALAIVGSRQMTAYGEQVLQSWIPHFVKVGLVITSGAVVGVDRTAQQLAINAGGQTVAILGYGHLSLQSRSQQYLLDSWRERGACILSGFSPNTIASKGSFLARNHLVAGICAGVLVIEAAAKSGSLHTAGLAADFGRPLMAVPGSVFNPFAVGTAALINQGGEIVTNVTDVLRCLRETGVQTVFMKTALESFGEKRDMSNNAQLSQVAQQIIQLLEGGDWQFGELLDRLRSSYTTAEILVAVSELELTDTIIRRGTQVLLAHT